MLSQHTSIVASHTEILNEVCEGILEFFNHAVGTLLLYSFERVQFKDLVDVMLQEKKRPSDMYGAEHLLRLFTKLPMIVSFHYASQNQLTLSLKEHLVSMLKYSVQTTTTLSF
jgi:mortality factor 4-like protein 1